MYIESSLVTHEGHKTFISYHFKKSRVAIINSFSGRASCDPKGLTRHSRQASAIISICFIFSYDQKIIRIFKLNYHYERISEFFFYGLIG